MKNRIKILTGAVLAIVGVLLTLVVGAFYSYSNAAVELGGIALIVFGLVLAKSTALANFLADILRF